MQDHAIRPAKAADVPALDAALRQLSRALGDPHRAGTDGLTKALFGSPRAAWARVATNGPDLTGIVLFSPVFSTVRGGPGTYVSDLWVDRAARGNGLGSALLRDVARHTSGLWGAVFLRLAVHDGNPRARTLYQDHGFEAAGGETVMVLAGEAFQRMRRMT